MAESSWPTPANGRVVDDSQYEKLGLSYGPTAGVVGDFTSPQLVYGDSTGMQIKIAADRYALVRGHEWWSGSSIFTKAIGANASGSTRTDLVVLRLSRTTYSVTVVVIAGTPGAGAPAPTQNVGTTGSFDLVLATVTVANGAATISAANVTYVAAHLRGDGGGYSVPSVAALAYVPLPVAGQTAALTPLGTPYTYNGTAWSTPLAFARKLANETISSNIAVQDDDDLFFSIEANAVYHVTLCLFYAAQLANDLRINFSGPASATFDYIINTIVSTGTGYIEDGCFPGAMGTDNIIGGLGGNTATAHLEGLLIVAGTAGTFRFRWAQGVSGASGTTVLAKSFMVGRRVA